MAGFMPEVLVGRHVGVVGAADIMLPQPGEARVHRVVADSGDNRPLSGYPAVDRGWGTDTDPARARIAAVMETFERQCLHGDAHPSPFTATRRALQARDRRHVSPESLATFTREQYAGDGFRLARPPGVDDEMSWVAGFDLVTGEEVALPRQYCLYTDHGGEEPVWYRSTSNGSGAGSTPWAACLSGLLELLERDAIMMLWHHRLRPPHLEVSDASPLGRLIARQVTAAEVEYRLIDLTGIHRIPVVLAVVWSRLNGRQVYSLGGAAGRTRAAAAHKALMEASMLNSNCREIVGTGHARLMSPDEVTDFDGHMQYYLHPDRQIGLDFLLESRSTLPVDDIVPAELAGPPATILRRVSHRLREEIAAEVYAVNLTPEGAETFDLHAYRVVAPKLYPLDCGHDLRHLRHPRLKVDPSGRPVVAEQLNSEPHPFP
ncbi:thiazole/oxazole-forming peptide maturase SagD family component [Stackebrandtia endophytica]|uniref:Thiazole/oxazole-forming peptide maturase SagD family component n=2 Tax=Stackebrandtia endophytica TaxID=1496996 RepID=A0A543AVZ9_9ACTN|nr:thiazole/oxazole-forming peptide maturase SagD family component [Stackebrandtia endophytica]